MPSHPVQLIGRAVRTAIAVTLAVPLLVGCAGRSPTEPDASRLVAVLNGATVALPGAAGLARTAGAPDSLVIWGSGWDVSIRVQVEYTGPGTYVLGPEHVEVWLLVGGDVRSGSYRGSVTVPGELRVLQADGSGAPLQAALRFDADHSGGERRFGPTATLREGLLTTRLQVWRP